MKTILVPIFNGIVARNFFRTDIYRNLISDFDIRIVVVIPSSKLEFYRKQFNKPKLILEPLDNIGEIRFGALLAGLAFNLLPTRTIWFRQYDRYLKYGNYFNFLLKRSINFFLGPFQFPKKIIRFLDRFVPADEEVLALLKKYHPNLLFTPDIAFGVDRVFLRAAKRKNIPSMAMVRSWDNLTSKGVIQILPDKLIAYTERMKKQAIKYAGMPEKGIVVTGPPGYDDFFRKPSLSREEFFRKIGVDPVKRLILFSPFYDRFTGSAVKMINNLVDAIENGKLPRNIHLLVRYRPATPEIPEGVIKKSPYVSISKPCESYFPIKTSLMLARKDWEFSEDDMQLLLHSLYFCDVMVNTFSTLTIDAAAFDKPSIGIRFDADPACPEIHSVKFVPDRHDHYKELEATGGVRLVRSMEELVRAINGYLENPRLDAEGRKKMREEQIQFFDGLSGKRVAEEIKKVIYKV